MINNKYIITGKDGMSKDNNRTTYLRTLKENREDLRNISTPKKIFLIGFFSYFIYTYKELMSELSRE